MSFADMKKRNSKRHNNIFFRISSASQEGNERAAELSVHQQLHENVPLRELTGREVPLSLIVDFS